MFKFFEIIITMLETVVGFVLNLFKMFGFILAFIAQGLLYVASCITYLPPWVLPFVLAVICFSVAMFILNR